MNNLFPKLMTDSSQSDGHAETIMDYVISWCLRCSKDEYGIEKPKLQRQCKTILCKLLEIPNNEDVTVVNVKTWKQEERIDLWVEVELIRNGYNEHHSILIENKYYTKLRFIKDHDGVKRNQLIVYKHKFDNYYDSNKINFIRHYLLITCIERDDSKFGIYNDANKYGFKILTYGDLVKNCSEETESDIYNEFWIRW